MKLNPTQRRNFISSWLILKQKPPIETVESLNQKMKTWNNHEIWYSCNSCGEQFDVRVELKFICPRCNSVDLRIG